MNYEKQYLKYRRRYMEGGNMRGGGTMAVSLNGTHIFTIQYEDGNLHSIFLELKAKLFELKSGRNPQPKIDDLYNRVSLVVDNADKLSSAFEISHNDYYEKLKMISYEELERNEFSINSSSFLVPYNKIKEITTESVEQLIFSNALEKGQRYLGKMFSLSMETSMDNIVDKIIEHKSFSLRNLLGGDYELPQHIEKSEDKQKIIRLIFINSIQQSFNGIDVIKNHYDRDVGFKKVDGAELLELPFMFDAEQIREYLDELSKNTDATTYILAFGIIFRTRKERNEKAAKEQAAKEQSEKEAHEAREKEAQEAREREEREGQMVHSIKTNICNSDIYNMEKIDPTPENINDFLNRIYVMDESNFIEKFGQHEKIHVNATTEDVDDSMKKLFDGDCNLDNLLKEYGENPLLLLDLQIPADDYFTTEGHKKYKAKLINEEKLSSFDMP